MTTIVAHHWIKPNDFIGNVTEKDFKLWEEQLDIDKLNEGGKYLHNTLEDKKIYLN